MPAMTRPYPRFPLLSENGKEGVDGSSPSEGFRKAQQMVFFVASAQYDQFLSDPQSAPKSCPQVPAGVSAWLDHWDRRAQSTSVLGRGSTVRFRQRSPKYSLPDR